MKQAGGDSSASTVRQPCRRSRRHDAVLIQALVIATLVIGTANVLAGLGRW
ncbi:hypothetical protein ACFSKM_27910 [Ancylobacter dichloromethanicus]